MPTNGEEGLSPLEPLAVNGGSNAIKRHLTETITWNGDAPRALVQHRLSPEGAIRASNWHLLGSLQRTQVTAKTIWPQAAATIKISLDIKDLSIFKFTGKLQCQHLDRQGGHQCRLH